MWKNHDLTPLSRMSASDHQYSNQVHADYSSLLEAATASQLVVAHCGTFTADDVNGIAFELEEKLKDSGARKGIVKRLFSIIIEALQNIRLHGLSHPQGGPGAYVVVKKIEEGYLLQTANIAAPQSQESLTNRLNKLNSLEGEALKQHYMDVLTNGEISEKGGAGLGFITIAMKSRNTVEFNFKPLQGEQDLLLFEMATLVKA